MDTEPTCCSVPESLQPSNDELLDDSPPLSSLPTDPVDRPSSSYEASHPSMPFPLSIRLVEVRGRHPKRRLLREDVESFLKRFEERGGFGGGGSEEVEGVGYSALDVSWGWRESKEVEGDGVKVGEGREEEGEAERDGGEESLDEMPNVERSGE